MNLLLGDKLVPWSWAAGRPVEYDPAVDRFSPADVAPMHRAEYVVPRVEVTGRFDWPG